MTAGGSVGMVLDRALTVDLLDVALRVATSTNGNPGARRVLSVALRDHVSAQEAEGKTKKCLSRVWVAPPEPARQMIRWAIDNQAEAGARSALHFGAILATFPFAGAVAAAAGRQLHLDGKVDPAQVKANVRAAHGDRSTIEVGARKVLTTMRYLGLLEGPDGGPFTVGAKPALSPKFSGWLLHALLLSRRVEGIATDEPPRAVELATLEVKAATPGYPLLETHAENGRTVAVARKP